MDGFMTELEAIEKLKALNVPMESDEWMPDQQHKDADEVLCAFLDSLGYSAVIDEYRKVDKWYS